MIKKIILIVIAIFLTVIPLSACKNEENIMDKYPSLTDKKHIIEELSAKEVIEKIANKESFSILLGFEACPWCQALMPEYNEVAKKQNLKEVYYLDIKDMRDNENSNDKIYYQALYSYFNEIVDQEKDRINAPTVLGIKDGNLTGYLIDTVPSHTINEAGILPPLTEEQREELHNLLTEIFNKI